MALPTARDQQWTSAMNRLAESKGHHEYRFRNVVVSFVAVVGRTANGGRQRCTDLHADRNGN